jgi:hypothetical protein
VRLASGVPLLSIAVADEVLGGRRELTEWLPVSVAYPEPFPGKAFPWDERSCRECVANRPSRGVHPRFHSPLRRMTSDQRGWNARFSLAQAVGRCGWKRPLRAANIAESKVLVDRLLNHPGFHAPSGFCEPAGRSVVPGDVVSGEVIDVAEGAQRAAAKRGIRADALVLVEPDRGLGQRVVVGVANAAGRWSQTRKAQCFTDLTLVY